MRFRLPLVLLVTLVSCATPEEKKVPDCHLQGTRIDAFPSVQVTTLAGSAKDGYADAPAGGALTALFSYPKGLAYDPAGALIVADSGNNRIRRIAPDGSVTTVAGTGEDGATNGMGGANGVASLGHPDGVAVDATGRIFVADTGNNLIRLIDTSGVVSTFAGGAASTIGSLADGTGGPDGTARFWDPAGLAIDINGDLLVADHSNHAIRRIDMQGNVTTVAGGPAGYQDGTGGLNGEARFSGPSGLAVDSAGNIFVADSLNGRVRKIDRTGRVSTVAGVKERGYVDGGPGLGAFQTIYGIAVSADGDLFVGDAAANAVRRIDRQGNTTTVAGNGIIGDADGSGGPCGTASLDAPKFLLPTPDGLIFSDSAGNRLRQVTIK